MPRRQAPKPMSAEAKAKVSAAKKAWWAKQKADPDWVHPSTGFKHSDESKAKMAAATKKFFAENPEAAKKNAAHRDAIRKGKLAYEASFDQVTCVASSCLEKTRHHLALCKNHLKLRIRANAYNTTVERLTQMYENQNGKCAICLKDIKLYGHPSRTETTRRAVIDHDHSTNEIRDLLCNNCNTLIGFAEENDQTLQNAIRYLSKIRDA
jgi:hypothetical protein